MRVQGRRGEEPMDCVTCLLMGMCMLCGPGIGGSQPKLDTGTDAPGRSLTQLEVAGVVQRALEKMEHKIESQRVTPVQSARLNHRRSFFPDPKFSSAGIGKRNLYTRRAIGNTLGPYTVIYRKLEGPLTMNIERKDPFRQLTTKQEIIPSYNLKQMFRTKLTNSGLDMRPFNTRQNPANIVRPTIKSGRIANILLKRHL
ncbi:hypothetical protein Btru_076970 [Bulinus truncatus]|nr:hypothetical protein Btru_076970 [Bulinus truncatus]